MDILNNQNMFEYFLKKSENMYHYGSFVYGTYQEGKSDKDYIVIVKDEDFVEEQVLTEKENFSFYSITKWQSLIDENAPIALEVYFLPEEFRIKENIKFNYFLDYKLIRQNFSKTASNSFVKCGKKLLIEKDYSPYIGKKSLWHALRLTLFEQEILKILLSEQESFDYKIANEYYEDIVLSSITDWDYFKSKYQPIYNRLKTQNRLLEKKLKGL